MIPGQEDALETLRAEMIALANERAKGFQKMVAKREVLIARLKKQLREAGIVPVDEQEQENQMAEAMAAPAARLPWTQDRRYTGRGGKLVSADELDEARDGR